MQKWMMRWLVGFLMLTGTATGASALSVDPNPVSFEGHGTSGEVIFDLTGTTLEMSISITRGKLARSKIAVYTADGDMREVSSAGIVSNEPNRVNVRHIRVRDDGSVDFYFKSSFFHRHIHHGQTSDPHYVTYTDLEAGDVITFTGYRHSIFGSFASVQTTIVPEPSAAALVGLGLLGLAICGGQKREP